MGYEYSQCCFVARPCQETSAIWYNRPAPYSLAGLNSLPCCCLADLLLNRWLSYLSTIIVTAPTPMLTANIWVIQRITCWPNSSKVVKVYTLTTSGGVVLCLHPIHVASILFMLSNFVVILIVSSVIREWRRWDCC